ncbi:hypothetical protein CALCODRAFT_499766 [Calocera cornea HHB12733]|uniref:Uncharacterized protein n=1 Tax=Calocera cornea HHB12733 TaxID=1353952 RepID=A0A165EC44_9BASI|nr:hypothetical protein CALCODRAFT_499766 [Calocera cornea HHB12733]
MVPLQPSNAHIFVYVDVDSRMPRLQEVIRQRGLPENDFNTLCREVHFLLDDQRMQFEDGRTYYLCRRCGSSYGQNAGQTWQMHPCGRLRVTLLRHAPRNPQRPRDQQQVYIPDSVKALESLKATAYRLRTEEAWLLWELVCEHCIELYLHYPEHSTVNMRYLLDRRLISPRVLNAAPGREAALRAVIDEEDVE